MLKPKRSAFKRAIMAHLNHSHVPRQPTTAAKLSKRSETMSNSVIWRLCHLKIALMQKWLVVVISQPTYIWEHQFLRAIPCWNLHHLFNKASSGLLSAHQTSVFSCVSSFKDGCNYPKRRCNDMYVCNTRVYISLWCWLHSHWTACFLFYSCSLGFGDDNENLRTVFWCFLWAESKFTSIMWKFSSNHECI